MSGTWTMGRQGDWLVRAEPGLAGQLIPVIKKSGESKNVFLERQIWSGDGIALYVPSKERHNRRMNEDDECEICGKNKYTCGHCVGW